MIITSKHEEREEKKKKKRARLVSQAGGCVAGPAGAAVCQFFVSPFGRSSWVLLRRRRAPTKDSGYSASYCFTLLISAAATGGRGFYKELGKYGQKLLSNLKLCLAHQHWRDV